MTRPAPRLSRREREIMDVIYRLGSASAADVVGGLAEPPSYSAVRTILGRLEEKGQLKHTKRGVQYVYSAVVSRNRARDSAVRGLVRTFFDGSASRLVSAILDRSTSSLSEAELDEIEAIIARERRARGEK